MNTWGDISLALQKALPGLDTDLRVAYIYQAYADILDRRAWKGLEETLVSQTFAEYVTGTVSVVAESAAVVGTGTTFTSSMVGRQFRISAGNEFYVVAAYISATSITLDRNYEGSTDTAAGFKIFQRLITLPGTVKSVEGVKIPSEAVGDLGEKTQFELDEIDGQRVTEGIPSYWLHYDDLPETEATILHRIELWPVPVKLMGIHIRYQKAAVGFDGTNTSAAPMPWVSRPAILAGAKFFQAADNGGDPNKHGVYESMITAMERQDNGRRGVVKLRMARRLTSHRRMRGRR